MVSDDRVDLDPSKEFTLGFYQAEQENTQGESNGGIDSVFDSRKDGNEDTNKEDDNLDWRDFPELVDNVWGGNKIANGVDDNGRERRVGDVEENSRKGIDGKEDDHSSEDTTERSSNSSLGGDSSTGERTSNWVSTEEWAKHIGGTNGDEFLRGVNGVVVDTTERLGDSNMLKQQDNDGSWNFTRESAQNTRVKDWDTSILEAY